jgi:hypothetical protein
MWRWADCHSTFMCLLSSSLFLIKLEGPVQACSGIAISLLKFILFVNVNLLDLHQFYVTYFYPVTVQISVYCLLCVCVSPCQQLRITHIR